MPRITAPTMAEHRARQRAALLAAGRQLLVEGGYARLTLGAVAERARLARSSVYVYFASKDELVAAVCEEELPRRLDAVRSAMAAAGDPRRQVAAFVRAQLDLVASGEHRLAATLASAPAGSPVRDCLSGLRRRLLPPLERVLAELAVPAPAVAAALVQGVVDAATARIEDGEAADVVRDHAVTLVTAGVGPPA